MNENIEIETAEIETGSVKEILADLGSSESQTVEEPRGLPF